MRQGGGSGGESRTLGEYEVHPGGCSMLWSKSSSSLLDYRVVPGDIGPGLQRGLHGELEPELTDSRERPGSGVLRGRREAVLFQVRNRGHCIRCR